MKNHLTNRKSRMTQVIAMLLALTMLSLFVLTAMADEGTEVPGTELTTNVTNEPAAEEPAVEEPAVEEPATEEPMVEEPAAEEPAVEEPAVEESVVEEPAVEEPAAEESVTEICVVTLIDKDGNPLPIIEVVKGETMKKPLAPEVGGYEFVHWYLVNHKLEGDAQKAFDFKNIIEADLILCALYEEKTDVLPEAPVQNEEPAVEEPAVEEPAVEEPAVEEPVVEEPAVEEPAVEEPVVEEPAVEEPAVEEPAVEEPVAEEPAVEEPVVEEPAVEEPAVEEPVVEEPAVEEAAAEEPAVEEPVDKDSEVYLADTLTSLANEPAAEPAPKPLNKALDNESETSEDEELGVLIAELIDELYPDRCIQIYAYWGEKEFAAFGDSICLTAKLIGYEALEYNLHWQYLDNQDDIWYDLEGETEEQLNLILDEINAQWFVRVQVEITGILP